MENNLPHLELKDQHKEIKYSGSGRGPTPPRKSQVEHGNFLLSKYEEAWKTAINNVDSITPAGKCRDGVYLQFNFEKKFDKQVTKLEKRKKGIHLCCFKQHNNGDSTAIVFIPNNQRELFSKMIKKYRNPQSNTKKGNPYNALFMNSITTIDCPKLKDFWQDDFKLLPNSSQKWIEFWINEPFNSDHFPRAEQRTTHILNSLNIRYQQNTLHFPEKTVLLIYANQEQLKQLISRSEDIAEFRIAKKSPQEWLELDLSSQSEFISDLNDRVSVEIDENMPVCVCILDGGVNCSHPLLNRLLQPEDCLACDNDWGGNDTGCNGVAGHGTAMAGLVAYGDLFPLLESTSSYVVNHILESVKIFPPNDENLPQLWGAITSQAISLAEIQAPKRKRIICSAATSNTTNDRGRPSSWSSEIDKAAFARMDNINGIETKRLIILATGNVSSEEPIDKYPDTQIMSPVQDPAQSWNAITVGAYTQLSYLTEVDLPVVAQPNQLSPFSSTSFLWDPYWPIKPEVVFEGGNAIVDNNRGSDCDDLSLLSTYHAFRNNRLLCSFSMTSAATALAANFVAKIQNHYPQFWSETIRALVIHSAEWTQELRTQFLNPSNPSNKRQLLCACGYGVPNLNKAMYSASNSLTLIAQSEIQPYIKSGSVYKFNKMHYYQLPWPKEALEMLGDTTVKMRITLSYFIEPYPGSINRVDRYHYPSYGLRFHLKHPEETSQEFRKRINKIKDEEDEIISDNKASRHRSLKWEIGPDLRNRGSIHSDTFVSSATEIRDCNEIIITPISGWWKNRPYLKMVESKTRYSLIVSLYTEELDVNLYTPVQNILQPMIQNPIQ